MMLQTDGCKSTPARTPAERERLNPPSLTRLHTHETLNGCSGGTSTVVEADEEEGRRELSQSSDWLPPVLPHQNVPSPTPDAPT